MWRGRNVSSIISSFQADTWWKLRLILLPPSKTKPFCHTFRNLLLWKMKELGYKDTQCGHRRWHISQTGVERRCWGKWHMKQLVGHEVCLGFWFATRKDLLKILARQYCVQIPKTILHLFPIWTSSLISNYLLHTSWTSLYSQKTPKQAFLQVLSLQRQWNFPEGRVRKWNLLKLWFLSPDSCVPFLGSIFLEFYILFIRENWYILSRSSSLWRICNILPFIFVLLC